jgi:hypothetical protein
MEAIMENKSTLNKITLDPAVVVGKPTILVGHRSLQGFEVK